MEINHENGGYPGYSFSRISGSSDTMGSGRSYEPPGCWAEVMGHEPDVRIIAIFHTRWHS